MTANNFCRACGSKQEPDARFCNACGAPVAALTAPVGVPKSVGAPRPAIRMSLKWWLGSFGFFLVLGLAYVVASPWLALSKIKTLAEQSDVVPLIDQLGREGIRRSVVQSVDDTVKHIREDDKAAGVPPSKLAEMLPENFSAELESGIDKLLSPEALREFQAKAKSPSNPSVLGGLIDKKKQAEAQAELKRLATEVEISSGYVGMNRFRVIASHAKFGNVTAYLTRSGLVDWQLDSLDVSDALSLLLRRFGGAASPEELANAALKGKSFALAQRWAEVAADQGSNTMQFKLGVLQLAGSEGLTPTPSEGLKNLESAAKGGNARAAYVLSNAHLYGFKVPKNSALAVTWAKKSYEIEPQFAWAQNLTNLYGQIGEIANAKEWNEVALHNLKSGNHDRRLNKYNVNRMIKFRHQVAAELNAALEENVSGKKAENWVGTMMSSAAGDVGRIYLGMTQKQVIEIFGVPSEVANIFETSGHEYTYASAFPSANLYLRLSSKSSSASVEMIHLSIDPRNSGVLEEFVSKIRSAAQGDPKVVQENEFSFDCPITSDSLLSFISDDKRQGVYIGGYRTSEIREKITFKFCSGKISDIIVKR